MVYNCNFLPLCQYEGARTTFLITLQHHPKRHTSWETIRWNLRKPNDSQSNTPRIQTNWRESKHLGRAHSHLQPTWLAIERSLPKREDRKWKSKPKIDHKVSRSLRVQFGPKSSGWLLSRNLWVNCNGYCFDYSNYRKNKPRKKGCPQGCF